MSFFCENKTCWRWRSKQRVRCRGLPCVLQRGPTSPLIPLTISGHFTHTTISHSPTLTPPAPGGDPGWVPGSPGEVQHPPRSLFISQLTWGPAGGDERRNISKMWHCLLSGCLGWLTDWPGGAHNERACRATPLPQSYPHLAPRQSQDQPAAQSEQLAWSDFFSGHQQGCCFLYYRVHFSFAFNDVVKGGEV